MKFTNSITFICWENDEPLNIQLEPGEDLYVVEPGNEIEFIGNSLTQPFKWAVRVEHKEGLIQLIPYSGGPCQIDVLKRKSIG